MTVYAPGTLERDPQKQNMALQAHASQIETANTNISTNTANIATNTANIATNTAAIAVLQTPACFSANKNGTNQTGIVSATFTQLTFGTEAYDVGAHFSSNAWTPPAGKVHMNAAAFATGTVTTGALMTLAIYKNGSIYRQGVSLLSSVIGGGASTVSCDDSATGSDAYTVYVYVTTSSGTATVDGQTLNTYFNGYWISA